MPLSNRSESARGRRRALADRAASAQTPASVGSQTTTPPAAPSGDDLGYVPPFSGSVLAAPMRLTLEGSISPRAGGFPQCASLEDDVGNSVGGIPVQHYTDWRLTPHLVLSVFTQLGCPIDAGMGAVVTYTVPIRPSVAWVFAAGAYAAPAQFPLYGGMQPALSLALKGASARSRLERISFGRLRTDTRTTWACRFWGRAGSRSRSEPASKSPRGPSPREHAEPRERT